MINVNGWIIDVVFIVSLCVGFAIAFVVQQEKIYRLEEDNKYLKQLLKKYTNERR